MIRRFLLILLLSSASILAYAADASSPVGVWRTIDDKTGKEKSLVRITEINGEFRGTIEKLFREPHEDQNPHCEKCTGDKKNKPVIGMVIMTGLKHDGEMYSGGEILDPAKCYSSPKTSIQHPRGNGRVCAASQSAQKSSSPMRCSSG